MRIITAMLLLALSGAPAEAFAGGVDVLTQHNDVERTGANLHETELTPATIKARFGQIGFLPVNGQVYAQPLVVSVVKFPDGDTHNVVYVATMKNFVYAFDADHPDDPPLWTQHLGDPVYYKYIPRSLGPLLGMYTIQPWIGITSTPVIDPGTKRLWVTAKMMESHDRIDYRLFCLDITTGKTVALSEPIEYGSTNEADRLQGKTALQRPALLLANHMIYAAFGSHMDSGSYHGWVVAFDAKTLAKKYVFCTTPGDPDGEGGIWQSGTGPAADKDGNIYVVVGNGMYNTNQQYGSSFVKLSPELKVLDSFTPWNWKKLSDDDLDLGTGGPLILPDTDDLLGGGKDGKLYLLDSHRMGGLQPKKSVAPALQIFKVSDHWTISALSGIPLFAHHHIHGCPVYWESAKSGKLIYVWPEATRLKMYRFNRKGHLHSHPFAVGPSSTMGMPGGELSLSANGDEDGLLWTTTPRKGSAELHTEPGLFRVFNADTLELLYSSKKDPMVENFSYAKYCAPTVANGKVYVATFSDRVDVYGLLPPEPAMPEWTNGGKAEPKHPK